MNQSNLIRSNIEQSHPNWTFLLIAVLSITLLFAIQASFAPALVETADMIAIPP